MGSWECRQEVIWVRVFSTRGAFTGAKRSLLLEPVSGAEYLGSDYPEGFVVTGDDAVVRVTTRLYDHDVVYLPHASVCPAYLTKRMLRDARETEKLVRELAAFKERYLRVTGVIACALFEIEEPAMTDAQAEAVGRVVQALLDHSMIWLG